MDVKHRVYYDRDLMPKQLNLILIFFMKMGNESAPMEGKELDLPAPESDPSLMN